MPWVVLVATFLTGRGAALTAPAFQAIVPDLVPKSELKAAVALNSVGINVSRAIGPALAGVVIAAFDIASSFLLNATSFVGVIAVLRTKSDSSIPVHRPKRSFCERTPLAASLTR